MPAGYSGTPLGKKLGYSDHGPVWTIAMPDGVRSEIDDYAPVPWQADNLGQNAQAAHLFFTRCADMEAALDTARKSVDDNGMVWVSWPKKASKVETDITEDVVREVALPLGFVDVKVCAVDAVWSGLKLVVRKELRKQ